MGRLSGLEEFEQRYRKQKLKGGETVKFEDRGNEKRIIFEDGDTDEEKRIVEQNLAMLRNLFTLIRNPKVVK